MNHIKRLTKDVAVLKKALHTYDDNIDHIVRYLQTSKFHKDTTVQVNDVLDRITSARMAVTEALDDLSDQARGCDGKGY